MRFRIAPETRPGWVRLTVSDLERSLRFYQHVLGMSVIGEENAEVRLGVDGEALVVLRERPGAKPKPRNARGLYHFAVLLPGRRDLARAYLRIVELWGLDGASDHLVSEALYLSDPDGHGIEVYADRMRALWKKLPTGELRMATLPLDIRSLLLRELGDEGELPGDDYRLPDGTRIGHIHLHVSRLERARAFYVDSLGMNLTFDLSVHGALFFAAGDYHHHVGANVWAGIDAPRPPESSVQLVSYSLVLPNREGLEAVVTHLRSRGLMVTEDAETLSGYAGYVVNDLDGNAVELVARD